MILCVCVSVMIIVFMIVTSELDFSDFIVFWLGKPSMELERLVFLLLLLSLNWN